MSKLLLLAGFLWLMLLPAATATSSPALNTLSAMRGAATAIEIFKMETGAFPNVAQWNNEVRKQAHGERWPTMHDFWGRDFIYRAPGEHAAYTLYSVGADGVDNGGVGDDISYGSGVNDGYYPKSGRPLARSVALVGGVITLGSLFLARWLSWWVIRAVFALLATATTLGADSLWENNSLSDWDALDLFAYALALFVFIRIALDLRNAQPLLRLND